MRTKIISFNIELAKKIQAGEIEGKIKTRDGQNVQIVHWNKKDKDGFVIVALIDKPRTDIVVSYTRDGEIGYDKELDLVLEVPDNEPQFKPFDKVLVRDNDASLWRAGFYSHELDNNHYAAGGYYKQCIPYEGNQELVGTTNKPKEK